MKIIFIGAVDFSRQILLKLIDLNAEIKDRNHGEYRDEMEEHPFPQSEQNIRSLATVRGATANVEYAEAFMLLREVF